MIGLFILAVPAAGRLGNGIQRKLLGIFCVSTATCHTSVDAQIAKSFKASFRIRLSLPLHRVAQTERLLEAIRIGPPHKGLNRQ